MLEVIERDGETQLRCIPCHHTYERVKATGGKKFNWSKGISNSRTWARYVEHVQTNVHLRAATLMANQENFKESRRIVKEKSVQELYNRNVEEELKTKNVLRNLYSGIKEHQSTSSVYSRLGCFDMYLQDLFCAIKRKTQAAQELQLAQPTEYRKKTVDELQNLLRSVPLLEKMVGESQEENFRNRSFKVKNMKLSLGERIYTKILLRTKSGKFHSFSSDGVEDIKVRHSINLFLQSETEVEGESLNYFARIEYAREAMNADGESKLLLEMLNTMLPGFTG